jgi:histidinol phosphatase-like enzyme
MAGDSFVDMRFAENAGMARVLIGDRSLAEDFSGLHFPTLYDFAEEFVR